MKRNLKLFAALLLTAAVVGCTKSKPVEQGRVYVESLPRVDTPAALSDSVDRMLQAAEADSLTIHSIMIVKDGDVVYEKWINGADAETPHILNSVSKTFTSMGVGLAISDSLMALDDKVVKFFPDQLPENVSDNLAAMTVRDLLTMSCGHQRDHTAEMREIAAQDSTLDWVKQFLSYPVESAPGEYFCYNSVGTMMLSAIVQKVTGKKLVEYVGERVFAPLNIKDARWEENNEGINYGGWGLYLKTEDLAKAGQLILQGGEWNGEQVLPADWVGEMQKKQHTSIHGTRTEADLDSAVVASSDWVQGYGYQMWRCRHNAFRADGANGQYILILPEKNAVIAITADLGNMQAELQLVWDYILPAL